MRFVFRLSLILSLQLAGWIAVPLAQDWDSRVTSLVDDEEVGDIVLTAVGDMIFNREITGFSEPEYQNLYRIIREADLGFGSLEMSLNEKPELQRGVYNFRRGSDFGWEILRLGINWVGLANNHTLDYGGEGLKDCLRRTSPKNSKASWSG